jgi:SAM-dependent methyltransferase
MVNVNLIIAKLRNAGVSGVLKFIGGHMAARPQIKDGFDARRGTETGGKQGLWSQRIDSLNARHGVHYQSAGEDYIKVLLDPLPRSATVVDMGCGKGRVLIIAAEMGFDRVVGVEFVPEWAELAKFNLQKTQLAATVVCGDAAVYEFPQEPLIVYLYNPFNDVVMSPVANRLKRHREDLDVWVVYVNPRHRELFDSWMEPVPLNARQSELFTAESVAIWHRGVQHFDD